VPLPRPVMVRHGNLNVQDSGQWDWCETDEDSPGRDILLMPGLLYGDLPNREIEISTARKAGNNPFPRSAGSPERHQNIKSQKGLQTWKFGRRSKNIYANKENWRKSN
jgi:hypothetical protein